MPVKDYYSILKVEPNASPAEIKKAYRRLALQFHPDRGMVSSSDRRFHEITEAYEVLSDFQRRESYNYERWHLRQTGQRFANIIDTPDELIFRVKEFRAYVDSLDIFRTNFDAIVQIGLKLMNANSMQMMSEWDQPEKLRSVIGEMSSVAARMPPRPAHALINRLIEISDNDSAAMEPILALQAKRKNSDHWEKWRVPVLLIVTALICLLIFLLSH
jgi:molecular chaperone DnaJ